MDYSKGLAATAPPAALAMTGTQPLWLTVAAVGLIGVGAAVLRFMPRKQN